MKKLNLLFTALLLVCCIGMAKAEEVTINGIKYDVVTEAKRATVIKGDNYYSGDIVIPSEITHNDVVCSVTSIGDWAFAYCGLTSITIPNSVTSIGWQAFYWCNGLTSIEIPNSVTSIGFEAFKGNSSLTSVVIGNSVISIGSYAFEDCYSLTSITIPNSVTSIGYRAFHYCTGLTNVVIGNGVTSIGKEAFQYCTGLTSVVIGNSVTSIGESAFESCSSLTSITIPNSVTSIGSDAFQGCTGLTNVVIGNSVTSIAGFAFHYCTGLTSVTSLIPADELFAIYSYVFSGVDKTICTLYVPDGAKETYASTVGWSEFTNIVELESGDGETTGIDEMKEQKTESKDVYYDLSGRAVENPANDIYIIDGKKVLVK